MNNRKSILSIHIENRLRIELRKISEKNGSLTRPSGYSESEIARIMIKEGLLLRSPQLVNDKSVDWSEVRSKQ